MDIAPFHKGQEIIAILNHSQNAFKKNDEFVVLSCWKGCCSWMVTVGIQKPRGLRNTCPLCYRKSTYITEQWIFFADAFRAKQALDFEAITSKEIMEIEQPLISTN